MKKHTILAFASLLFVSASCASEPLPEGDFSIIGTWGMKSGSITDDSGTQTYPDLGKNNYYQIIEYKYDGTYKKTTMPTNAVSYGTYSYNDSNQTLRYKLNSDKYYVNAYVTVVSAREMTVLTDWESIGSMTQYFVKL